tara:strand:+ start:3526 stop:3939 length:414 start_codon:yes stop_codon:yes gene_type:complete
MGFLGLGKASGEAVGEVVKEGLNGVNKILDTVITNYEERGKLDIAFQKLQTDINLAESKNSSLFVSGWRPFTGWVCSFGVGFNYVLRPFLNYVLAVFYPLVEQMDALDMSQLMPLLMGMLGFGALRTYEKVKKKARN